MQPYYFLAHGPSLSHLIEVEVYRKWREARAAREGLPQERAYRLTRNVPHANGYKPGWAEEKTLEERQAPWVITAR